MKREELNTNIVSAFFNTIVKKRIVNTYTFSNFDINKFFLLLLKDIYTYEKMSDSKKINETSLQEKKGFCSHLNMKQSMLMQIAHTQK